MNTTRRLSAAAAVLLLIGIVVLWVDVHCFCRAFYKQEYQKLNTAQSIGMTEQGLEQTTEALLAYLRGEQEDLSLSIPINGQEREVFNAREKAHMADVKTLYIRARWVGYGSLSSLICANALSTVSGRLDERFWAAICGAMYASLLRWR